MQCISKQQTCQKMRVLHSQPAIDLYKFESFALCFYGIDHCKDLWLIITTHFTLSD